MKTKLSRKQAIERLSKREPIEPNQYCEDLIQQEMKSQHTPTPFRNVSFDGFGINDTDQFASRIAKLQPYYLSFGPEMAKRWNTHEELLEALYMALPYIETALADQGYKPGVVERKVKQIKDALAKAEGE